MPARLAQRHAGVEQPGPIDQSGLQRRGQRVVGTRGVANSGEAARERRLEDRLRPDPQYHRRDPVDQRRVHLYAICVEMRIDQPGHDEPTAYIDHRRGSTGDALADFTNHAVLDKDRLVIRYVTADPIEDAAALDKKHDIP